MIFSYYLSLSAFELLCLQKKSLFPMYCVHGGNNLPYNFANVCTLMINGYKLTAQMHF